MILLNGFKIEQGKFPDGTLLMKFDREFDFNNVIMWKYESDAEMFAVMCLVNHIRVALVAARSCKKYQDKQLRPIQMWLGLKQI